MGTAIYVRISQDTGLTRAGVKRQRADCESLCTAHKWGRLVYYEDNDTSAYSGRKRPAYEQMMDAVIAGEIDRIVAWHPDRLHRQPAELEGFIKTIETTGCAVATVTTGLYDLATTDGQFMARVIGAAAKKESDDKARRVRRKHLELAQAGAWSGGGNRPFGYHTLTGKPVVDHQEADVVREMMARFLAGQSARSIAAWLRETNVPTVNKGVWRTNTVTGILTGAIIAGQREHHGRIVADAQWPGIVTPDEVARTRAIVAANPPLRRRDTRSLLVGLCRCGRCGARMYAGTSKGKPIMCCAAAPNGCRRVSMLRDPLEAVIVEAVLAATDTVRLPAEKAKNRLAARTIRDAEQQLDELAAAYGNKIISLREWLAAREPIEQRVAEANTAGGDTRNTTLLPFAGKPGALRSAWPRLDHGAHQAIIRALISTITVAPGVKGRKTFDLGRLDIGWKV